MNIIGAGIDTVLVEVWGLVDYEKIENPALIKKYCREKRETTILCIKLCTLIQNGKVLLTVGESRKALTGFLDGMKWNVKRIDISIDSKEQMGENKNLLRAFIECLSFVRGKELPKVYETTVSIARKGNLKISGRRVDTTIYSCKDKNREANSRLENQVKDIRTLKKENFKIIEDVFKDYIQELYGMENLMEKVEVRMVEELYKIYCKTIGKNFITFSEFIAWADYEGYIITSGVLKGLMLEVGLSIGYKKFVENFRNTRIESLNFTNKTELKNFIKAVRKNLKIALKN